MKGHVIDGGRYVQILINNGEVETIERKELNRKAFTLKFIAAEIWGHSQYDIYLFNCN